MKAWLRLFLPLAAVIVAVFAFYAHGESDRKLEQHIEREQSRLHMAEMHLREELSEATVDLRVMASAPALRRFVDADPATAEIVAMLFSTFVGEDSSYDRVSLLDAQGRELVSVVRTPEGPRTLPAAELGRQDDPLARRAPTLASREVEIGRFALDEEGGRIVVPHKPVLRMGIRVAGDQGHPDHAIVAKLRGAVLLRGLRDLVAYGDGEVWLLDPDGYWIFAPDRPLPWGAQLDPTRRLAVQLPALADRLATAGAGTGSVGIDGALYVHRHIEPLVRRVNDGLVAAPPEFDLVALTPAERMPPAWPLDLALAMVTVLLLAAVGCAILARLRERSLQIERRQRELLEERAAANEMQSWIKEHLYQLGLKIHAARTPEGLGAAMLSELASTLGLAAACAYALQEERAQPIAGFALSEDLARRTFAPGEGLVGEALRSRREVRLRPPPAGYLDVGGGAGDGPAAEIRILPLWVHERTVGVLELAFSRPLQPREEDFLRQVLPLLAVNLEMLLDRRLATRAAPA